MYEYRVIGIQSIKNCENNIYDFNIISIIFVTLHFITPYIKRTSFPMIMTEIYEDFD